MYYALVISFLFALSYPRELSAQCVVNQDANQLLTTTCTSRGGPSLQRLSAAKSPAGEMTRLYQGSPCLTYPVWQEGTLQIDATSKPIAGSIQYDVAANQVYYSSQEGKSEIVRPAQFTIQGRTFIDQPAKSLASRAPHYYEVVYKGKTLLLVQHRRRLIPFFVEDRPKVLIGGQSSGYDGRYEEKTDYYVQAPNGSLKAITLTSQSVLSALPEPTEPVKALLSAKVVTVNQVVKALGIYDSSTAQ